MIVDLSFPERNSVNSGIWNYLYLGEDIRLRFPKVDNLVKSSEEAG